MILLKFFSALQRHSFIIILFTLSGFSSLLAQCDGSDRYLEEVTIQNDFREAGLGLVGFLNFSDGAFLHDLNEDLAFSMWSACAIVAGGTNASGDLKLSTADYSYGDFKAGPIIEDPAVCEDFWMYYLRAWKVESFEIIELKEKFQNGNLELTDIPLDILEWPARGNPHIGMFAPAGDMAPFHDFNNDQLYNPLDGDYPIVLVENEDFLPLEFYFTVYNDNNVHLSSQGEPINLEIHQVNYVLQSFESELANHAVFTRFKYIYKGTEVLENFKLGIWEDNDLGNSFNDMVGVDTINRTNYMYNRKGYDDDLEFEFSNVPDSLGAIRGKLFLTNEIDSYISHRSLQVPHHLPKIAEQYYHALSGKWNDGSKMTYGGSGYDSLANDYVSHIYPDLPTDPAGWSLENDDQWQYVFGGFRTITTIVSRDLSPGDEGVVDYLDYLIFDGNSKGFEIFDIYQESIDELRSFHQRILDNELSQNTLVKVGSEQFKLFPNPALNKLQLKLEKAFSGSLEIVNAQGKIMRRISLNVESDYVIPIDVLLPGLYYIKLVSSNGEYAIQNFMKQ